MAPIIEQILNHRAAEDYALLPPHLQNVHIQSVLKLLRSNSFKREDWAQYEEDQNPLDSLDPSLDTLPYLYILVAQAVAASKRKAAPPDSLSPKIELFLRHFNPIEARYAGTEWRRLVELTMVLARRSGLEEEAHWATSIIAGALLRLDPSAGTLTSNHINFVRLCVECRAFADAARILDCDIHSFPSKDVPDETETFYCTRFPLSNGFITARSGITEKITFSGVMEYYMLGAMAYIGLKRWSHAQYFLEHILSTPTTNVTAGPMLEAYRKWILVTLMLNGKASPLPRTLNTLVHRQAKAASRHYESIAEAFLLPNPAKLLAEIHEAQPYFVEDGNLGLVQQVAQHHRDLAVIQLGETFDALPLSDIANLLNLTIEQVREYTEALILERKLNARIEPSQKGDGSDDLRFSRDLTSGPLAKSEQQLHNELVVQTERIKRLAEHVNETDRRLSLSKEFIEYTKKQRKAQEEREPIAGDPMDVFDVRGPQSDDENVMADFG